MIKVRVIFEKKGRAKYISHLDMNMFMMRVFRKSGLPVWYTEGYNPHPYISFALALSLGFESEYEVMDFSLTEGVSFGKVKKSLNDVMPEGLKILSVITPEYNVKDITESEYSVELLTESPEGLSTELENFLNLNEICVEKKSKKGMKIIDIKPDIEVTGTEIHENKLILNIKLPAGTQTNFNPTLFTKAFEEFSDMKFSTGKICRRSIICADGNFFI